MTNTREPMTVPSAIAFQVNPGRMAPLDPQSVALDAPVARPTLRSVLRRIIDALVERCERKASERAIRYLRTRKELSDDFRNEIERRFMGQ